MYIFVWYGACLLVDLLLDGGGGLCLLGGQEAAQPAQSLVADNKGSRDSGLALAHEALLLDLLGFAGVDLEHVVAALKALVVREQDQAAGIVVQIGGGLLDNGEALVDAVEGLVTKGIGASDVRRDVLVRLGEPGKDGSSKGLVGRVAELQGALSVLIGLDGVNAVADQGIGEEVLWGKICQLTIPLVILY